MTKLELQQMLQSMDHYTLYSDDYSVVEHGRKQRDFILEQLDNGIRSGLSYSCVATLGEFWSKATFVEQSTAGQFESNTHVKARFYEKEDRL